MCKLYQHWKGKALGPWNVVHSKLKDSTRKPISENNNDMITSSMQIWRGGLEDFMQAVTLRMSGMAFATERLTKIDS